MKKIGAGLFFLCGIVFLIVFNISTSKNETEFEKLDDIMYFEDFSLLDVNGDAYTQENLSEYKITVINGWAPWCGPCTAEMPTFEKLNNEYRDMGLQVIGIVADYDTNNESDYDDKIKGVIDSTNVSYPVLLSDSEFHNGPFSLMNNAYPGTWVVDGKGQLIDFVSGAATEEEWRYRFDKWLEDR